MKQFLFFIPFFTSVFLFGQDITKGPTVPIKPRSEQLTEVSNSEIVDTMPLVRLLAKVTKDKIKLRWAPKDPRVWIQGNQFGYVLERMLITADTSKPLTWTKVFPEPIKPLPLDDWKDIAVEDKYCAIAAQCIHGEKKVTLENSNRWDAADAFYNRYGFALLAADFSSVAAGASGLYMEESTSTLEKTVVAYRISLAKSVDTSLVIDTTFISVVPGLETVLSPPIIRETVSGDHTVKIVLDKALNRNYSGFFLERSDDGGNTYIKLNELPHLNTSTDITQYNSTISFSDSIPTNYKKYKYRITGANSFGELSEFSESIDGMGVDLVPPSSPTNVEAVEIEDRKIEINWSWADSLDQGDLAGFNIIRSITAKKGYSQINDELLPPTTRSFLDDSHKEMYVNYYIISAVDTAGNASYSLLTSCKIVDNYPPEPPTGMEGVMDSQGVVTLTWDIGPEDDIMGYQVYYANDSTHVFTQITPGPLQYHTWYDTVQVNTLTESVFYKFVAIDLNYNYSKFSKVLEVKRPDIVPPVPPLFEDYEVTMDGVTFQWIPSSSEDAIIHRIFRAKDGDTWELLETIEGSPDKIYTDTKVEEGLYYTYYLQVEDDAGHIVECPKELRVLARGEKYKPGADNIQVKTDKNALVLAWELPDNNAKSIIYRSQGDEKFKTYKHIIAGQTQFKDFSVKKDTPYRYSIQVIYPNGKMSRLSDQIATQLNP